MRLYKILQGPLVEDNGLFYLIDHDWDELMKVESLTDPLRSAIANIKPVVDHQNLLVDIRAPIGKQEVWAAGVTYYRSRDARMEESEEAGSSDFYQNVYDAERPELFFKSPHYRVKGPGEQVRIRGDATWTVPEPELALIISPGGNILGYSIGNDMSSRDIEGENPLYLPQAKTYDGSAALGPCIYVPESPISPDTEIRLEIFREGGSIFSGSTTVRQIKREFSELINFLYRETTFPNGCILFTGTGIIPDDDFTLESDDIIIISIDEIGTLTNPVA